MTVTAFHATPESTTPPRPVRRPRLTGGLRRFALSLALAALTSCSRSQLEAPGTPEPVFEPVPAPEAILDDLPVASLLEGIRGQASVLERQREGLLRFGRRTVSAASYRNALIELYSFIRGRHTNREVADYVRQHFDFVAVDHASGAGIVQVTAYFEPIIRGSRTPTPQLSHPLYRKPGDMIVFRDSRGEIQRHRRTANGQRVPSYYTRREIDLGGVLRDRNLEICYVDPLDAFILQTQGSGTIEFQDGTTLRLNFAEKNGYPYTGLGKLTEGKIPGRVRSLKELETGLRAMPREQLLNILSGNLSYIFFRPGGDNAITAVGVPAIAGRTIATDRSIYPKGTLAFLVFGRPTFDASGSELPTGFRTTTRFVVDQDVGSAILGPKRVDLFIGRGDTAKREAGAINGSGRLLYLVPK